MKRRAAHPPHTPRASADRRRTCRRRQPYRPLHAAPMRGQHAALLVSSENLPVCPPGDTGRTPLKSRSGRPLSANGPGGPAFHERRTVTLRAILDSHRGLGAARCVFIQFSLVSPKHDSSRASSPSRGALGLRKGRTCRAGRARTPPPRVNPGTRAQRAPGPQLSSPSGSSFKRMELEANILSGTGHVSSAQRHGACGCHPGERRLPTPPPPPKCHRVLRRAPG